MDQHHHELTVSLSSQPIWVYADPARIEQVVVNLLTNAAKYTADGGTISIVVLREGDEAVLRVRDSGLPPNCFLKFLNFSLKRIDPWIVPKAAWELILSAPLKPYCNRPPK